MFLKEVKWRPSIYVGPHILEVVSYMKNGLHINLIKSCYGLEAI